MTLSQLPTPSVDAVVTATDDGHAALALATAVHAQDATLVSPTG